MCVTRLFQKNDLNTVKVIFYDVIGDSIGVYNFILLKSSIKTFYIPGEPSFNEIYPIINVRSRLKQNEAENYENKNIEPHQSFTGSCKNRVVEYSFQK